MTDLYIGLMSGTSVDGIDAALVDFSENKPQVLATHYTPYSSELRKDILAMCQKGENEIQRMGELDIILGKEFGKAALTLLQKSATDPMNIQAIGSHGQTIRHHPESTQPFTLQIGDPNTIAATTGITTIADFRRKDMAYGGQGAPLVPAFHHFAYASTNENRVIVNIGGIANVTLLLTNAKNPIVGFDTGPGNVLMDAWINLHKNESHDRDGAWAAEGKVNDDLLQQMLNDAYFKKEPPKSTGREYFNLDWLQSYLKRVNHSLALQDIQATLAELTAQSIMQAIQTLAPTCEVLICGGGTRNQHLMQRLTAIAPTSFSVNSITKYGIDPDWVEAVAFAWLARQTFNRQHGNLPSVTGASTATILGGIYFK